MIHRTMKESPGTMMTLFWWQLNLIVSFFLGASFFFMAYFLMSGSRRKILTLLSGLFLSMALLTKPIIFPVLLFLILRFLLDLFARLRRKEAVGLSPEGWIVTSAAAFALAAILMTLIVPGGISLDHHIRFLNRLLLFYSETARAFSPGHINLLIICILSMALICAADALMTGARNKTPLIIIGICLSMALLAKPIIFPVFLFFLIRFLATLPGHVRSRNKGGLSPEGWIFLSASSFVVLAVLAALAVAPGCISLEPYASLFGQGKETAVDNLFRNTWNLSPTAVLIRSRLLPQRPELISVSILAVLIAIASIFTLSSSRPFALDLLTPWIFATLLWFPCCGTHYGCWTYGAFLILFSRMRRLPYNHKRLIFSSALFLGFAMMNIRTHLLFMWGSVLLFLLSCAFLRDKAEAAVHQRSPACPPGI